MSLKINYIIHPKLTHDENALFTITNFNVVNFSSQRLTRDGVVTGGMSNISEKETGHNYKLLN